MATPAPEPAPVLQASPAVAGNPVAISTVDPATAPPASDLPPMVQAALRTDDIQAMRAEMLASVPPYMRAEMAALSDEEFRAYTLAAAQQKVNWREAVDSGSIEKMKEVIANGCSIDFRDSYDKTALMDAAIKGHKQLARWLLREGANIEMLDSRGMSALDWAKAYGRYDIEQMIHDERFLRRERAAREQT